MPTSSAMVMFPVHGGEKSKNDQSLKVYGTYHGASAREICFIAVGLPPGSDYYYYRPPLKTKAPGL